MASSKVFRPCKLEGSKTEQNTVVYLWEFNFSCSCIRERISMIPIIYKYHTSQYAVEVI
jgi:cell fate (sporulation/competence/biofilm development) regulator YmcA (YheA/YmcA/DUF963 family)